MKLILADTVYLLAYLDSRDRYHRAARRFASQFPLLVTSDLILSELLNSLAGGHYRMVAAGAVLAWMEAQRVRVIHHDRNMYLEAVKLYRDRPDKGWSLTDCASFLIMDRLRIQDALTADHHFEQAGYTALLRDRN